jgi:adenylate cyclase
MPSPARPRFHIGFRTSIISLLMGIVLVVGLALVYLSFNRVTSITRSAASSFIDTVAQLSADRINTRLKAVSDSLDILRGIPSAQNATLVDNPRLYALMASMLRNNRQLYSLYMGYDDGTFLELEAIDRADEKVRTRAGVPKDAKFRLLLIAKAAENGRLVSSTKYLTESLASITQTPGPTDYDPRSRPWYRDAFGPHASLLTDPYIFVSTGEVGYTLRMPIAAGRHGVVAGDISLEEAATMLRNQQLGQSGRAFLFDSMGRVVAHPDMEKLLEASTRRGPGELPRLDAIDDIGLSAAIASWQATGSTQQFFNDSHGRVYAASFRRIETAGTANLNFGLFAPVDEFYAKIENERRALFAVAVGLVLAALPIAFWIGSMLSRSLRMLAQETDSIQRFEFTSVPQLHSPIREIDDLGRSVFTMRTLVQTFSSFIPKRLVQQLVETGDAITLGGERREVSVLFTDVENFTSMTERANPDHVMRFTSRYFAAFSEAITAANGTVDKFIGDAIMGIWNAPIEDPQHVAHACAAVLACIKANYRLNADFDQEGWPAYRTRFGLHAGDAVVGNIGSPDRMNYTVLGATVNLAARLESLNKSYGTTALVSEAVKQQAGPSFVFRSVDRIRPKGFEDEFPVFELCGMKDSSGTANLAAIAEWEKVYAAIMESRPDAPSLLRGYLERYPRDGVAAYHAQAGARA